MRPQENASADSRVVEDEVRSGSDRKDRRPNHRLRRVGQKAVQNDASSHQDEERRRRWMSGNTSDISGWSRIPVADNEQPGRGQPEKQPVGEYHVRQELIVR